MDGQVEEYVRGRYAIRVGGQFGPRNVQRHPPRTPLSVRDLNFRVVDHQEVGQTSQDMRVCRY